MIVQLFSVYDSAARRYLEPFSAETIEVAIRMFRSLVNKPDHGFSRFPADYTLIHIGHFDGETGFIVPLAVPHPLGIAIEFVSPAQLKLEI